MRSMQLLAIDGILSRGGLANTAFRTAHIVVAVVWIGLLYWFNFVQAPALDDLERDPRDERTRNLLLTGIARRTLWWFRWAAFATFITGMLILLAADGYFNEQFGESTSGLAISTGMFLGIVMVLNVWGVIWRAQKTVLADAAARLDGADPDPEAAVAARRAFVASRQNVVFSVSAIFFMVYKTHGPLQRFDLTSADKGLWWGATMLLIGVLEANCLGVAPWKFEPNRGLNRLYDGPGVRNPVLASFGLLALFLLLTEVVYR